MPKIRTSMKDQLLCTRVTRPIKEAVVHESQSEGLTPSEWLRNIIVKELRSREALPKVFGLPKFKEDR